MLSLVLAACLVGSLSAGLPDVFVSYKDATLSFRMKHFSGLKELYIDYQLGSQAKQDPARGVASRTSDGAWVLEVKDVALKIGDNVRYSVHGLSTSGRHQEREINWVYAPVPSYGNRRCRGPVVFRDDFNSLDMTHWDFEVSMYGGMNGEFQVYTPEPYNVYTSNGHLFIKPTKTTDDPRWNETYLYNGVMDCVEIWGNCTQAAMNGCHREGRYGILPPVMSGKLKSKATIRYGTVEVRARIPKGDWLWPAIWMMPRDSVYGDWPRSGEIDIMESRGNVKANGHGVNEVSSTMHFGTNIVDNYLHMNRTTGSRETDDWSNDFHIWRLEWTPEHIVTFVDDQQVMRVTPPSDGFCEMVYGMNATSNIWSAGEKMAPFDQEFYVILNVAVGGTIGFFPDSWDYGYKKPWSNRSPRAAQDFWEARSLWEPSWIGDRVAMEIDYIEMRQL